MRMEQRPDYRESFQPSRRLILQALRQGRSLLHISSGLVEDVSVTQSRGLGWSFCCPVAGDATNGWCLYVSGKGARSGAYVIKEEDLAPDLRFTELVAQFLGSVRQVRLLQEQKTQLSTFFSPKVIESLSDVRRSNEFLAPAERNVTVLFCDVRGFSRKAEALEGALLTLLHSVSGALQVMAGAIQDHDGTIADFQGDAALGFWGWPVATVDGPLPACRAALQIEREFRQGNALPGGPLEGFAIGLGIAHGRAVAGQIGTPRQAKVGVFGPVVNQGSRLEGLTKQFGVSICLDEATAQYIRTSLPPDAGRLRRLAKVRPKGMETPLTVYALLPPATQHVAWTTGLLDQHEEAVDALLAGQWDRAREIWRRFPTTDGPAQRLLAWMTDLGDRPPDDWDGAFTLASK
jgi:adenylate cyclase